MGSSHMIKNVLIISLSLQFLVLHPIVFYYFCHSNQRKYDFDNNFLGPSHTRKKKITGKAKKEMAGKTFHSATLKATACANVDEDSDTDNKLHLENDKAETPKKK